MLNLAEMLPKRLDMWQFSDSLSKNKELCKKYSENELSLGPYFFPKCQDVLSPLGRRFCQNIWSRKSIDHKHIYLFMLPKKGSIWLLNTLSEIKL